MKQQINDLLLKMQNGENCISETANQILDLFTITTSLPIERHDAEKWLQEKKDIWNHPVITDRTDKESYEVADLMAEFANDLLNL